MNMVIIFLIVEKSSGNKKYKQLHGKLDVIFSPKNSINRFLIVCHFFMYLKMQNDCRLKVISSNLYLFDFTNPISIIYKWAKQRS